MCSAHPTEYLNVYCASCSVPICAQCALFDSSHKSHEFKPLDDILGELVLQIEAKIQPVRAKRVFFNASLNVLYIKLLNFAGAVLRVYHMCK